MNEDYVVEESRPVLTKRKFWMTGQGCGVNTCRILDIKKKAIYEHVVLDYDGHNEEPLTFFVNRRIVSPY